MGHLRLLPHREARGSRIRRNVLNRGTGERPLKNQRETKHAMIRWETQKWYRQRTQSDQDRAFVVFFSPHGVGCKGHS